MHVNCPLCQCKQIIDFFQDSRRQYYRCTQCCLVFVDPSNHLSPADEKAIYDQHENHFEDDGYCRFLGRCITPLLKVLPPIAEGIDVGCGPSPVLARLMKNKGYSMAVYDPYYAPDAYVLSRQYDFVTCAEAIEHFYQPSKEWALLLDLLKPSGYLAIMTKLVIDVVAFSRWHYKNDQTHVSFFSKATFQYLAKRDGLSVDFIGNDVILMRKKSK